MTQTAPTEQATTLAQRLAALGVTMTALFVPQSLSRNAKPAKGEKLRPSLNWKLSVSRERAGRRATIETDYMQGIAHVPNYPMWAHTVDEKNFQRDQDKACESGKYNTSGLGRLPRYVALPAPDLAHVVASLLRDASGLDQPFETWAADLGYDEDSRTAETIYRACCKIDNELRSMFTREEREELQALADAEGL